MAQISQIFDYYDPGNRGKIQIEFLPKILRMLNYNIGNAELEDPMLVVDSKSIGFFSKNDLYSLLSQYQFRTDKQKELLAALKLLDEDADGYIPKDWLKNIL